LKYGICERKSILDRVLKGMYIACKWTKSFSLNFVLRKLIRTFVGMAMQVRSKLLCHVHHLNSYFKCWLEKYIFDTVKGFIAKPFCLEQSSPTFSPQTYANQINLSNDCRGINNCNTFQSKNSRRYPFNNLLCFIIRIEYYIYSMHYYNKSNTPYI